MSANMGGAKLSAVPNCPGTGEKFAKYQMPKSEIAEVIVKEALEGLGISFLIIRSVVELDVWKRCSQLYLKAVISVSGVDKKGKGFKRDEYDLHMVFPDGDTLNWILVEVKNSDN